MENQEISKSDKYYLYFVGAIFSIVALQAFFIPIKMLEPLELTISTVSGFAEIRAAYSGLFGSFGILYIRGARDNSLTKIALQCAFSVLSIFALGRFYSLLMDGNPNPYSYFIHTMELIGSFTAFRLLKKH